MKLVFAAVLGTVALWLPSVHHAERSSLILFGGGFGQAGHA
jgi:hypothetical protein